MDVSQYLEIFIDESNEHLQNLSDGIMILEKEPDNSDTINEIFRAAHSLKGMAGTMGYKRMQNLTHDMENVFSEVRNGNIKVDSRMVDVLFQCLDALEQYVNNIQETSDEGTDDNEPIIKALNSFIVNNEDKGVLPEEAKKEEAPAEEKKEESTDVAGTYARYNNMVFADFEKNAVNEAIEKKMNVFIIKVSVDENCILKAARAFLVFKNLEGHCDIIKSEPSAQDIEDEKFELDFSIVVVTEESYESIVGIIKNVSEIKDAAGEAITTPFADEDDKEEKQDTPKQEEKKDESETKPSAPVTAKKQAPVANNNKAGKTVSHTVRVDIEKLDVLMNLVSELIIAKNGLVSASVSEDGTTSVNQKFGEQIEYLERVTTNLHESVMKVRMMPIESVFAKYPRMIRDLNKKLGKKMELYMSGEETELDRTVIDEIGDPIMHLLRNSADHGLESAEIRAERGKPEVGSIWLDAYQEGNNVVIEVRDDGNGIDVEKVKQKAVEKGNLTQEQADALTEKEAIDLLFKPSFSTSDKVTDVSGRGVGLDVVKFFPAEAAGGLNMIKSMAAPYVNMKFMPTGGINAKNLTNYLDFNKIIACGGSWMVSKDLVAAKDWAGITALTKEAVSTMLGFKLLHVGVNNASEEAAASDSAKFATLLGQDVKVGNSSMFVGSLIEMMKNPGRGTCGHIAIQTNYLARAMYHLEKRGFVFDESSFKYDAKGNITVAYLKDEIAGFAVHFNQK